jgi:hypothetical protein
MRLINVKTKQLRELSKEEKGPEKYAILSHTSGRSETEVSVEDLTNFESKTEEAKAKVQGKEGWWKIFKACQKAISDGHEWLWADSCCIDRSIPEEWSNSVKSMFDLYKEAAVCYAFLEDVAKFTDDTKPKSSYRFNEDHFKRSEWFTQLWTLQALIVPRKVKFFDKRFSSIGTRRTLRSVISDATGIDEHVLKGTKSLNDVSVATRISWAAIRPTAKEKDMIYCLMGILGVMINVDAGHDADQAFFELQRKVRDTVHDQSLFAWQPPAAQKLTKSNPLKGVKRVKDGLSLFAKSPMYFEGSAGIFTKKHNPSPKKVDVGGARASIRIEPMPYIEGFYLGILGCAYEKKSGELGPRLAIVLEKVGEDKYIRHPDAPLLVHQQLK